MKKPFLYFLIVTPLVLVSGGCGRKTAYVTGFRWQSVIQIQEYREVTEEDWAVPPEGAALDSRNELHHYTTEYQYGPYWSFDDGFEIGWHLETVPVYMPKYRYKIMRWVDSRKVELTGHGKEPQWPQFQLGDNEREGERKQIFWVELKNSDDKDETVECSPENWNQLEIRKIYKMRKHSEGKAVLGPEIQIENTK